MKWTALTTPAMVLFTSAQCMTTTLFGSGLTVAVTIDNPGGPIPAFSSSAADLATTTESVNRVTNLGIPTNSTTTGLEQATTGTLEASNSLLAINTTLTTINSSTFESSSLLETTDEGLTATDTAAAGSQASPTVSQATATPVVRDVQVGLNGSLSFMPNQLSANTGDTIRFVFHAVNHSVVEGSINSPCNTSVDGFNSGFSQFNPNDDDNVTMSFTVNSPAPRFFFCSQMEPIVHCNLGMVFALNPGDNFNQFARNVLELGPFSGLASATSADVVTLTADGEAIVTTLSSNVSIPFVTPNISTVVLPTLATARESSTLVEKRR